MRPASQLLSPVVRGDTWNGIGTTNIQVNGAAPTFPVASARMHFRSSPAAATPTLALTSADGDIVIDNADTWLMHVIPVTPFPLAAGVWYWDLETTDSAGTVKTYVTGTLHVLQDVTR